VCECCARSDANIEIEDFRFVEIAFDNDHQEDIAQKEKQRSDGADV
jgi:hypothetical protein